MSQDPKHQPQKQFHVELEERLDHLSRQIDEWVDDAQSRGDTLKRLVTEARQQPFLLDGAPPTAGSGEEETAGPVGDLADFARDVENSADQGKILSRLISGAAALAPRVLLFIVKHDQVRGWAARGFHNGFNPRMVMASLADESLLSESFANCTVVRQSPSASTGNTSLSEILGTPQEMLAVPMWVRDRVVAILYADTTGVPWFPDALSVMVSLAALSLEALPARSRYPRPLGEQTGSVLRVQPADTPAAVQTQASAVTPDVMPDSDAELTREPEMHAPPVTHSSEAPVPEASTLPAEPTPELVPGAPLASYKLGNAEETEEGNPAEVALQEEARRFARLLVSEIVLYNETAIEEGRRSKDLYDRLKDDIERSRRMYEQRMSSQLPDATSYFRDELVEALADGDSTALVLPWS